MTKPFSAESILKGLKDFQRRTVEYVFSRFYGEDPTSRFLVADEVGLGKTLVAKGIVAKTVEHLLKNGGEKRAVNIVYVCSNAAIAAQNSKRLKISDENIIPTRLTLLPLDLEKFSPSGVNFISLTSGTAFEHNGWRGGSAEERLVLYHILYQLFEGHANAKKLRKGLRNFLRATVGKENWKRRCEETLGKIFVPELVNSFGKEVNADQKLYAELEECCAIFTRYSNNDVIPWQDSDQRYTLISKLRSRLASVCISSLKPDLLILDEFQRFKHLLEIKDDEDCTDNAAKLAQELFLREGTKVLLLSATPYKMFTLDAEKDDDHYPDFISTLKFLFQDNQKETKVKQLLEEHRHALHALSENENSGLNTKKALEEILLSVMCRTERVQNSSDGNSMLAEVRQKAPLRPDDLRYAKLIHELAEHTGAGDQIEYWKSVPHLYSFMGGYELRNKLDKNRDRRPPAMTRLAISSTLYDSLKKSEPLDAGNPRMRALFADTIDRNMWRLLWMPPSMPYTKPFGKYEKSEGLTKSLVFSSWSAVPDAVAVLCSCAAEQKMIGKHERQSLYNKIKRLLLFAKDSKNDRLTGMPVLALMMPFPTLAKEIDPLRLARQAGKILSIRQMRKRACSICKGLLKTLPQGKGRKEDPRWYWTAPILIEKQAGSALPEWGALLKNWLEAGFDTREKENKDDYDSHFKSHIEEVCKACSDDQSEALISTLGKRPHDLPDVLCNLALAAPGTCALRALCRVAGEGTACEILLTSAAKIASGFRTLFNSPESIAMLRQGNDDSQDENEESKSAYWRKVLEYGLEGNLQAMLDEHVHMLKTQSKELDEIAEDIHATLTLKAVSISVDCFDGAGKCYPVKARCRFALRFGDGSGEDGAPVARADLVRKAFNSPFRPFVLASTSIGQEGLDFHTWCHAITHWNLPPNPVDLEQREGRVHRYKGHAVRKNIAKKYGLNALPMNFSEGDPWEMLFQAALRDRQKDCSDLIPYWIFEGGPQKEGYARVERRVPLIPYSTDVEKFERLKQGLALYRVAFGQPRQEDLLFSMSKRGITDGEKLSQLLISLEPPKEMRA